MQTEDRTAKGTKVAKKKQKNFTPFLCFVVSFSSAIGLTFTLIILNVSEMGAKGMIHEGHENFFLVIFVSFVDDVVHI